MFQKLPSSYLYRAEQWEVKLLGLCRSQELWYLCLADTDVQYSTVQYRAVQRCTVQVPRSVVGPVTVAWSHRHRPVQLFSSRWYLYYLWLLMFSTLLHWLDLMTQSGISSDMSSDMSSAIRSILQVLVSTVIWWKSSVLQLSVLEWPRARLASSSNQGGLCLSAGVNLPCINYRKNDINLRWRD